MLPCSTANVLQSKVASLPASQLAMYSLPPQCIVPKRITPPLSTLRAHEDLKGHEGHEGHEGQFVDEASILD